MTQAKLGDTVSVHYTGKLDDGTVFDSSSGREPLQFDLGSGQVIPGFEQAVVGMTPGESKTQTIPAAEAYGDYFPEMVMVVSRDQFPADFPVSIGQQLQIQQQGGPPIPVVITEVQNDEVTLDANHPLAGENLIFEIELVAIG